MNTLRLAEHVMWRSILYGLFGGTLLGAGFAIAVVVLGNISSILEGQADLSATALLLGLPFSLVVASVWGCLFGAPVGLLLGGVNGVLTVALTRAFSPVQNALCYRRITRAVCTGTSVTLAPPALQIVGHRLGFGVMPDRSKVLGVDAFYLIPAAIAGLAVWWVSGRLVTTAEAVAASSLSEMSATATSEAAAEAYMARRMTVLILVQLLLCVVIAFVTGICTLPQP